ncbi:invasion associated locus B family protein [Xanthobacter sp. KR7-225]|uniref:invasion associated locus B family protein n=1 Tax=Xanthobacter sp. KR7-225 TaxID=3156613 RepID=UPI0032B54396
MAPRRIHPTLLGVFLASLAITPSMAQGQPQSKSVAQYGDWVVYASTGGPKVCYAITQPKARLPEGLNRDPAFLFVSTRPSQNVKEEVSITVGFPLKEKSTVTVTVGTTKFELYTQDQGAWVRNAADEAKLVDAMRKGRDVTVVSTSSRGNETTDKYSLSGVSQALDRVAQECK